MKPEESVRPRIILTHTKKILTHTHTHTHTLSSRRREKRKTCGKEGLARETTSMQRNEDKK